MTAAVTSIRNATSDFVPLPLPLQAVLAPSQEVHSTITLADLATLYNCSVAAIQGIEVTGVTHPRLPVIARSSDPGTEATAGVDDAPDFIGRDVNLDDAVIDSLTAVTVTASSLTATRVPIVSTGGLLVDDADMTWSGGNKLTVTNAEVTTALTQGASGSMAAGSGGISTTGDLSAAGGFRQQVGPFIGTLAASQTDTVVRPCGVASAPGWVPQRAGSVVGFSIAISEAVTGAGLQAAASVRIAGTKIAATLLAVTQAGGETVASYAVAKDVALHTFAAGLAGLIDVVYTSGAIENTPVLSAWVEIEQ